MKKPILKRNKHGVVLLSVLCIMMVLIIVVTATFSVVVASDKKALTNYTDSQSYITAKNVLTTYCNALQTDGTMHTEFLPKVNATTGIKVILPSGSGVGNFGTASDLMITSDSALDVNMPAPAPYYDASNNYIVTTITRRTYKISETVKDNLSSSTVSQYMQLTDTKIDTYYPGTPGNPGTPGGANPSDWDSAAKALEGFGIGTSTRIFGGSSSNNGSVQLRGFGGSTSSWFYRGDINISDSGNPHLTGLDGAANLGAGKSIVTMGNFTLSNDVKICSISDGSGKPPFIYAGGQFVNNNSNQPIGTSGKPVNIICHGGSINKPMTVNGNIYSAGDFSFSDNQARINGNMYVNGNVSVNTNNIQNSARPADIAAQFGGTVRYSGSASSIDSKVAAMRASGNSAGADALRQTFIQDTSLTNMNLDGDRSTEADDPNDPSDDTTTASDNRTLVNLPAGGGISENVTLPTEDDTFGSCMDDSKNPITADGKLGNELTHFTSSDPRPDVTPNSNIADVTGATSDPTYTCKPGDYGTTTINVPEGETRYINMTGGNYSGDIIVAGGGKVEIYSTGDCNLQNFRLMTDKTRDMISGDKTFNIGNQSDLTASSNIYWYAKDGTKVIMDSIGPGKNLINGYIYACGANTLIDIRSKGVQLNVNDSGAQQNGLLTSILGGVIAQNILVNGETALAYLDPNAGGKNGNNGGTPGTPGTPPPPSSSTSTYDWPMASFTYYSNH